MALARHCVRLLRPCFTVNSCVKSTNRSTQCVFPVIRSIHTSCMMSKEQIEDLEKNPFFEKYADKISKLQKTSPEEFLSRLATQEEAKKKKTDAIPNDFSLPSKPKAARAMDNIHEKTLEKIAKLELLVDRTPEEITVIWTEFWKNKDAVSAVIPSATYKTMENRFKEFNTFLFPLPRDQGYEFVMVQFAGKEAHFSTLINYQAHRENAPECLSIVHYTELAESKGIVLMVGEYDKDVLTEGGESRCLVAQLIQYYGKAREGVDKKWGHLFRFHYESDHFNPMDLVLELETDPGYSTQPFTPTVEGG